MGVRSRVTKNGSGLGRMPARASQPSYLAAILRSTSGPAPAHTNTKYIKDLWVLVERSLLDLVAILMLGISFN